MWWGGECKEGVGREGCLHTHNTHTHTAAACKRCSAYVLCLCALVYSMHLMCVHTPLVASVQEARVLLQVAVLLAGLMKQQLQLLEGDDAILGDGRKEGKGWHSWQ